MRDGFFRQVRSESVLAAGRRKHEEEKKVPPNQLMT